MERQVTRTEFKQKYNARSSNYWVVVTKYYRYDHGINTRLTLMSSSFTAFSGGNDRLAQDISRAVISYMNPHLGPFAWTEIVCYEGTWGKFNFSLLERDLIEAHETLAVAKGRDKEYGHSVVPADRIISFLEPTFEELAQVADSLILPKSQLAEQEILVKCERYEG